MGQSCPDTDTFRQPYAEQFLEITGRNKSTLVKPTGSIKAIVEFQWHYPTLLAQTNVAWDKNLTIAFIDPGTVVDTGTAVDAALLSMLALLSIVTLLSALALLPALIHCPPRFSSTLRKSTTQLVLRPGLRST